MACIPISDQAFLSSVLAHLDCQARTLGDSGYHALSQPGSTGAGLLVPALTIFIAIMGYRLLLGERFDTREMVMAAVKIGAVLLIATSWPAVKTLLYDVVHQGPSQLVQQIAGAAALPGGEGDLANRLQLVDWELDELHQRGSGAISRDTAGETATGTARGIDYARDLSWLGFGRLIFLASTIASIALVRFAGGILLALAPLFALLLLFDATRGLFLGWLQGLLASALGSLFVSIALGIELALLEPWLASMIEMRRAEIATPSAPMEILVLALVFAGTMAGLLYLALRMAQGLMHRASYHGDGSIAVWRSLLDLSRSSARSDEIRRDHSAPPERSRALAVADAVARSAEAQAGRRTLSVTGTPSSAKRNGESPAMVTPLGQSFRRRTQNRASSAMARRNRT